MAWARRSNTSTQKRSKTNDNSEENSWIHRTQITKKRKALSCIAMPRNDFIIPDRDKDLELIDVYDKENKNSNQNNFKIKSNEGLASRLSFSKPSKTLPLFTGSFLGEKKNISCSDYSSRVNKALNLNLSNRRKLQERKPEIQLLSTPQVVFSNKVTYDSLLSSKSNIDSKKECDNKASNNWWADDLLLGLDSTETRRTNQSSSSHVSDNFVKLNMRKRYKGSSGNAKKRPSYIRCIKGSNVLNIQDAAPFLDPLDAIIEDETAKDFILCPEENELVENSDEKDSTPLIASSSSSLLQQLRLVFKHPTFRSGQEWAINRCLQGNNSLLILSTGSGKSLCYQMPSLFLSGLTLVISPLVSLMYDQLQNLPCGISGATLSGQQTFEETIEILRKIRLGLVKILFISPERLVSSSFQRLVSYDDFFPSIDLLCIDEAHCISEWSHNFRPSYLRIKDTLKGKLKPKSILALTATASKRVIESISQSLNIGEEDVWKEHWNRSNLKLIVEKINQDEDRYNRIHSLLSNFPYNQGSIIVYVHQQKQTEVISDLLRSQGIKSAAYHAGMEQEKRKKTQTGFMKGRIRVVVATVAFGMGVDKRNVRGVIHFHLPNSLEHYIQEIGRAGRDGKLSFCHLFLVEQDFLLRHSLAYSTGVEQETIHRFLKLILHDKSVRINAEETNYPVEITLPIEHMEITMDMKSSIIETLLVFLDTSSSNHKIIDLMPSLKATCIVKVKKSMLESLSLEELTRYMKEISSFEDIEDGYMSMRSFRFNIIELSKKMGSSISDRFIVQELLRLKKLNIISNYSLTEFSFHFLLLNPIDDQKLKELENYLYTKSQEIETIGVNKILDTYNVMKRSSSSKKQVEKYLKYYENKSIREEEDSIELMKMKEKCISNEITSYLSSIERKDFKVKDDNEDDEENKSISPFSHIGQEEQVKMTIERDVNALASSSQVREVIEILTPRAIARIFHGLSSPSFPGKVWRDTFFWGRYSTVDFFFVLQSARNVFNRRKEIETEI